MKIEAAARMQAATNLKYDKYKVSDLVTSDVLENLKDIAKFVFTANISSTYNQASRDIMKNREYTAKELKEDIKLLQDGLKHAITELADISKSVGK